MANPPKLNSRIKLISTSGCWHVKSGEGACGRIRRAVHQQTISLRGFIFKETPLRLCIACHHDFRYYTWNDWRVSWWRLDERGMKAKIWKQLQGIEDSGYVTREMKQDRMVKVVRGRLKTVFQRLCGKWGVTKCTLREKPLATVPFNTYQDDHGYQEIFIIKCTRPLTKPTRDKLYQIWDLIHSNHLWPEIHHCDPILIQLGVLKPSDLSISKAGIRERQLQSLLQQADWSLFGKGYAPNIKENLELHPAGVRVEFQKRVKKMARREVKEFLEELTSKAS